MQKLEILQSQNRIINWFKEKYKYWLNKIKMCLNIYKLKMYLLSLIL